MPRYFSQTFGVVGAILEKDGKIALVKENMPNKPDNGKWNQPAGWIEVGEDPIVSVKREVEEETGFEFEPTGVLSICSLVRKDLTDFYQATPHAIKIIFVGKIKTDNQKNLHNDISEIKWFSPEEIYNMGSQTLRDNDIKDLVKDYFVGKHYPLKLIKHTIQN